MPHHRKIKLMFLAFAILIGLACSAQSKDAPPKSACEVTFSTFDGLPTQVLVGTDIENIASFKASSSALEGAYHTDIGGAVLTIHIIQTEKGRTLKRIFMEPGKPEDAHDYFPVCISDGRLSADKLKGKIVEDGLLILEEQPDVEGIPDNLWIFYKRK